MQDKTLIFSHWLLLVIFVQKELETNPILATNKCRRYITLLINLKNKSPDTVKIKVANKLLV